MATPRHTNPKRQRDRLTIPPVSEPAAHTHRKKHFRPYSHL